MNPYSIYPNNSHPKTPKSEFSLKELVGLSSIYFNQNFAERNFKKQSFQKNQKDTLQRINRPSSITQTNSQIFLFREIETERTRKRANPDR